MALSSVKTDTILPPDINNEEELWKNNPELAKRKILIESLLDKNTTSKTETRDRPVKTAIAPAQNSGAADSVEITVVSMEMYQRESGRIAIDSGSGNLEIRWQHEELAQLSLQTSSSQQQPQAADPLILDLNGNGLELGDLARGQSVLFDINADGVTEKVAWVSPRDGFLALDRNGNGTIDNGAELFGNQNGAIDGFAELARFDENNDSVIDEADSVFEHLRVWQDRNSNGLSTPEELASLSRYGITAITLDVTSSDDSINGNQVTGYAAYSTSSGSGLMGEAYLNYYA